MTAKTLPKDWNGMLDKMEAALGTVLAQAEKCCALQDDGEETAPAGDSGNEDGRFREGLRTRWEKVEDLLNEVDEKLEEEETALRVLLEEAQTARTGLRGWLEGERVQGAGEGTEVPASFSTEP